MPNSNSDVPYIHGSCPYALCSARVRIINSPPYPGSGKESEFIIVEHQIKHPILTGICPATLFHLPLKPEEQEHLHVFAVRDGRKIGEQIQAEANAKERRLTEEAHRPNGGKNPGRYVHNTWFGSQVWTTDPKAGERRQKANWAKQSDDTLRRDGLIGGSSMNIGEAVALARHAADTSDKAKAAFTELEENLGVAAALVDEIGQDAFALSNIEVDGALATLHQAITNAHGQIETMHVALAAAIAEMGRAKEAAENHINRLES